MAIDKIYIARMYSMKGYIKEDDYADLYKWFRSWNDNFDLHEELFKITYTDYIYFLTGMLPSDVN